MGKKKNFSFFFFKWYFIIQPSSFSTLFLITPYFSFIWQNFIHHLEYISSFLLKKSLARRSSSIQGGRYATHATCHNWIWRIYTYTYREWHICNQLALTYFSLLQTQVCLYVYLCHRTLKSIMLPILNSGHNVETHPTKDTKYLYLGGTLKYIMHYLWYYSCSDMFMINRQSEPRY